MGHLSRRKVLGAIAAIPAAWSIQPTWADTEVFSPTLDAASKLEQLNSLVISQGGEIHAARAFRGPNLDHPVNVKSVSKSIISAMTGIAIEKGEIDGIDTLIAPLIARSVPRRADKRVRQITIEHMLSMKSGLQDVSGANYGAWVDTKHWIYEALSKPMLSDPGTDVHYSTASYHVLGAVLAKVGGMDLHQLARQRIGDPLNTHIPRWAKDPQGRYVGGNDMRVSPFGMIKFGEMYRNKGLHEGTRILSEEWIEQSWTPYGNSKETGHGYGFGWFIWNFDGYETYYARGYGGQLIFVVPSLELTVAISSDFARPATLDGHLGAIFDLFASQIIPIAAKA